MDILLRMFIMFVSARNILVEFFDVLERTLMSLLALEIFQTIT